MPILRFVTVVWGVAVEMMGTIQKHQHPNTYVSRYSKSCAREHLGICLFGYLVTWLFVTSIVTAVATAASEVRHEGATEIFHCPFDRETWDVNYDGWPDRWERLSGPQYPHYVNFEIRHKPESTSGNMLHIGLDGAGAAISSPPIRVLPRFMYVLEARLRMEKTENTPLVVTLSFYDAKGHLLDSHESEPIRRTRGWEKLHLGPISLTNPLIDRAVIGIKATSERQGDLEGEIWIDDVWLARLPRMTVRTNNPFNVYTNKDDVVVVCELSGIRERDPEVRFQLLDEMSKPLNGDIGDSLRLNGKLIVEDSKKFSDIVDGFGDKPAGFEGTTSWKPPLPDYGYYRIAVRMLSNDPKRGATDEEREMYRREVTVAVVPPLVAPNEGEFGWTLPHADHPHSFSQLTQLLPKVGINWVKFPAWYDPNDPERGDEIVHFAELLGASNIDVVGMLVAPPETSEAYDHFDPTQSIASMFLNVDPAYWQPSLDPVMTRLALRIRWWQLGGDHDRGFVESINLSERFAQLQPRMFRFGQEVNLGFGRPWDADLQTTGRVPWDFEVLSATPAPNADQLFRLLSKPIEGGAERWVLIEPPAPSTEADVTAEEDVKRRVTELICQIVAAKQHSASTILFHDPFDDELGLMRSDGTPGELLLPWRTAASMLSAAQYLGQLQLPGGSENRVFKRKDGQLVMVVWNDHPVEEVMYLGDELRQFDCWGRQTTPAADEHRQIIQVDSFPSYVLGLHEAVTRWRLALQFDSAEVPSIFRVEHPNALQVTNAFKQGVGGSFAIIVPEKERPAVDATDGGRPLATALNTSWSIDPPHGDFTMAAGEQRDFPLAIVLKGASYGRQPIRVDFEVDADKLYKFSIYRDMHVGLGNIDIQLTSHLDNDGTLVVEQVMTNREDKLVDFNCYLYADGYRRQRSQVYRLGSEEHRKRYLFPDGESLVGKELLLEAVEFEGSRILKYEFTVTR